jgi:murein L,D-transpeptidase YafK
MQRTPLIKNKILPKGVFLFFLFLLLFPFSGKSQATPFEILIRNFPEQVVPLKLPLKKPKIRVIKAQRLLYLYDNDRLLRIYPVALGFEAIGEKIKQGDGRTPEGNYFIVAKNPKSKFYLSLAINYPNLRDAELALAQGRIQRAEFEAIKAAEIKKTIPPWNTVLGGEIFIHGNGTRYDWTDGCIALENFQMKELYQAVPQGTPVEILP